VLSAGLGGLEKRTFLAAAGNLTKVPPSRYSVPSPNFDHKNTKSNAKIV